MGMLYAFDRITGKPIWPIPERKVEKGNVPGEWYSPTQPIPSKPKAYSRTGTSIDELIDFTPALRAEAMELVKKYKMGPIYTPPVLSNPNGPIATFMVGTATGGTNWPGGSFNPENHTVYTYLLRCLHVVHGPGSAASGHDRSALCRRSDGSEDRDGQRRRRRPGRRCGARAQAAAPRPPPVAMAAAHAVPSSRACPC